MQKDIYLFYLILFILQKISIEYKFQFLYQTNPKRTTLIILLESATLWHRNTT